MVRRKLRWSEETIEVNEPSEPKLDQPKDPSFRKFLGLLGAGAVGGATVLAAPKVLDMLIRPAKAFSSPPTGATISPAYLSLVPQASRPSGIPQGGIWLGTDNEPKMYDGVNDILVRHQEFNVKSYGAKGDGATDDTAAIQATINAASLVSFGTVFLPMGTYKTTSALALVSGITIYGTGNTRGSTAGSVIVNSVSDVFSFTTGAGSFIFRDFAVDAKPGAGNIFMFSGSTVSMTVFENLACIQENAGKAIVQSVTSNGALGFFGNTFRDGYYQYADGNTVPAFNIQGGTINQLVFEELRITQAATTTASTYAIEIVCVNASQPGQVLIFRDITFEQPRGGAIWLQSQTKVQIHSCGVFDLAVTPDNALFHISKNAGSSPSSEVEVDCLFCTPGTVGSPDVFFEGDVAGQGGFSVKHSTLSFLKGGVSAAGMVYIENSSIANFTNTLRVIIGGDVTSIQYAGGAASWDLMAGSPGNFDGYFLVRRAGGTIGGINTLGTLVWGTNLTSPMWAVTTGGQIVRLAGISTSLGGIGLTGANIKAGAPVDADFTSPADGLIVVDTTNVKLWVRVGGLWKGVVVA